MLLTQEKFGIRLRELRLDRKWSQERLARALECSRQTIVNIEEGKSGPSFKISQKLFKEFPTLRDLM